MCEFLKNVGKCVRGKRIAATRMTGDARYRYTNGLLDLSLCVDRIEVALCLQALKLP